MAKSRRNPQQIAADDWGLVFSGLGFACKKEIQAERLPREKIRQIEVRLTASIDGRELGERVLRSQVCVGADAVVTSSAAPKPAHLVALLLSELTPGARTRILNTLPELFAGNDDALPTVDEEILAQAEAMLTRLRARKTVNRKGNVVAPYSLTPIA